MNPYFRVIRAGLVLKASKDVACLRDTEDKSEIRSLAHDISLVCRLLDYIDNGKPFWFDDFDGF